jgi:hypothetical protein
MLAGGAWLLFLVGRRLWHRNVRWWEQAKDGRKILGQARKYLVLAALPSFVAWCAGIAVIAIIDPGPCWEVAGPVGAACSAVRVLKRPPSGPLASSGVSATIR